MPDGAMEQAQNIVISRDGVISKRRAFYQYYNPTPDTLNSLCVYQSKLLAIFSDKVGYFTDAGSSPNYTGTRSALSGATVAVTGTRVARVAQSNNNLYFTTDNGVLKLEAYNSSVYKAGTPPATDLRGNFLPANGFVGGETELAWRVVFGRRDANDNLLLGVPSDILTLTNSKQSGVAFTRAANVATVTTTSAHGLATGMSITITASADADMGLGAQTVTVDSATQFHFSETGAGITSTLDYTVTRTARLEFSVPSEITTTADGYFYQIYRSSQSATSSTSPSADFKLVDEQKITSAQITAGAVFYDDDSSDTILGAELYTNPNSREGELQGNDRPPLCDDVTLFKNHVFYANANTRHLIDLQVVDTSSLATADFVEAKVGTVVRRCLARTGVGNSRVTSESVTSSGGHILVTYTAHGLATDDQIYISSVTAGTLTVGAYYVIKIGADTFKITTSIAGTAVANNSETAVDFQGVRSRETAVAGVAWTRTSNVVTVTSTAHGLSTGMTVYVATSAGGTPDVTAALYTITVTSANAFTFAETAANDASGNTLTYASYPYMFQLDNSSSSASVKLRNTAQGLVKAMNRDTSSLVYAKYISGITDTPGKFRLQAKGFTTAIYLRASGATPGAALNPILPASFSSGDQVYSRNDDLPNFFYSSKIGEPEAVPLINYFPVGARNKAILRIVALRDSVIVIKEDGIFRVNGDSTSTFQVSTVDPTVVCLSASSVALLNNQVLCLTNQGVCLVSDSSVQILSRKVEDPVQAVLGVSTLATITGAVAYESDRLYMLTTAEPNGTTAGVSYLYNILNDTWTTSDALFTQGAVGPSDTLYLITAGGVIAKERKNQSRVDYCGQNYTVTVTSVATGSLTAVIVSADAVPEAGDVIIKSDVFNRLATVTLVSGTSYTVTFERQCNLAAADSLQLYSGYESVIKLAPFHAGLVGRMKQFAQMQVHFRDPSCSNIQIAYTGATYGGSDLEDWASSNITGSSGWGNESWGYFPWGLEDGVNNTYGTQNSPILRTYIPVQQQRNTYIQPTLTHVNAGEAINIQAIAFAVRAYGERTSR